MVSKKAEWETRPLTTSELTEIREIASKKLLALEQQARETPLSTLPSWVRPEAKSDWLDHRSEKCRYFDSHGFLVVPGFAQSITENTTQALKDQMEYLANNEWDLGVSDKIDTFGTDTKSNASRGDYFLDSSDRVHYFAEVDAMDPETKQLKPEFQDNKLAALNKSGHGMHTIPGAFREYTMSKQILELVLDLGWQDPVVPQSMYIFKQPDIGGTVHSHQDSTFLHTTPKQSCLGLWLALDNATLENGCLWVRPGSHREPLRRQFIRNPDYFEEKKEDAAKLIFRQLDDSSHVDWEGGLPTNHSLIDARFIPVEVKAGDLVTFCGTLDHLSLPNVSKHPRHTFQLHLVEGPKAEVPVTWSTSNWLQYPPGKQFVRLLGPHTYE
jgi:phytanoyl-CoA hydroxylase